MSEQPLDLSRVLALCAFGYNQRARQCLLAIVPEALGEQLGSAWRLGDELLDSATGPCEERLAAPWLALRAQPDLVEEESETTESGAPSPDQMPTGDVDVDAFFAAGEATHETDAALESTGLPPGEGAQQVDSQLPATLVARLMIGATDQKAADLLSDLPLALQGEVLTKIARSTALSVRRDLEEEERGALQALRDILSDDTESWGVSRTCQILRSLDGTPPLRRALGSAADVDAEVVAVVQSHLFEFDDLARLRDTELQALLGTCDNANLARALFDTTEAMRDRVMANVSDRRAGLLTDETDLHAESTPDEIDLARREILARARVLYEQGAITTYFGSVAIESDLQVAEEEEEAEERQEKPERKRPSSPERPEPESGRKLRRLVLAFVAMGLSALLLVQVASWLTSPSRSPVETTRPSRSSSGESGRRIAVASPSGSTSGSARSARRLQPGQSLRIPAGVDALLEFPTSEGSTRVDVESGAQVQGLPSVAPAQGSADSVACFYLRVGRVKVSVAADRFIVRTPVGQIDATSGSVFRVRVVLDGSMRVESMAGSASVMTRARQRWTLTPNQSLSVEPDGSATRAEVESGM